MGEGSHIEWTDHTFNPWIGCTKVSPACDHCYAEAWSKRYGRAEWGNHPRQRTKNWSGPRKWERNAEAFMAKHGRRQRVFSASLADVFDNQVPSEWRADLFRLIRETPSLDWLLLTKRPQNIAKMLPEDWGEEGYRNVWLGMTGENQTELERRAAAFLDVPAAVHFLSAEPLLGPLDLTRIVTRAPDGQTGTVNGLTGSRSWHGGAVVAHNIFPAFDWIIVGGEDGPRPVHPDWVRTIRDQCAAAGVAFLFKQWGAWAPGAANTGRPGDSLMARVGKKAAGRTLDGKVYDGYPVAA